MAIWAVQKGGRAFLAGVVDSRGLAPTIRVPFADAPADPSAPERPPAARLPPCLAVGTAAVVATVAAASASVAARRRGRAVLRAGAAPVAWRGDIPPQSSLPLRPDGSVDYTSIDESPVSQVMFGTVRRLMAEEAGHETPTTGYAGMIELAREVNDMEGTAQDVQTRARRVFEGILPALFIGWVPPLWKNYVQSSTPSWFGNFSFFVVFYTLFPWLMGPMEGDDHVDVEVPQALRKILFFLPEKVKVPQSVKAERCRFLEQSGCASVCVNSCKVPSQEWLRDDFGMELHIQPNYDDFSCRWRFGKVAPPLEEDEAVMVPCFAKCPSKFRGDKDALSLREKLRKEDDERLARAIAELTPDGTALSVESLAVRNSAVQKGGKCWSVDEERLAKRAVPEA